jgi:hypothetical protein
MISVRRVVLSTILTGALSMPAYAGPLLFTFEGTIPTLNRTTVVNTLSGGVTTSVTTPSVFLNVPVSGRFTFDSDVWSMVGAPFSPFFPFRQFSVTDPSNSPPLVGVDTPELLRGTLDVGGIGTLPIDRSLIDTLPPTGFVSFPYQGTTTMGFMDGAEGLNVGPFEFGDAFSASVSNGFAWFDFTASTPGDVIFRSGSSSIGITVVSQYSSAFVLNNLFPAGPPLAFSFVDPNPGDCSAPAICDDGLFSFGSFFVFSGVGTLTADGAVGIDTTINAPAIVVNRARLEPVVAPEPASLALFTLGAAAMGLARRRV